MSVGVLIRNPTTLEEAYELAKYLDVNLPSQRQEERIEAFVFYSPDQERRKFVPCSSHSETRVNSSRSEGYRNFGSNTPARRDASLSPRMNRRSAFNPRTERCGDR